jgi:hypothetical protein
MKSIEQKKDRQVFGATLVCLCILILSACTNGEREIPDTAFTKELGARNHRISKDRALAMLRAYDQNADSLRNGIFRNDSLVLPISETFNLRAMDSLLTQPGIAGVRAYLSMDPATRKLKLILIGVNSNGIDILQNSRRSGKMELKGGDSLDYIADEAHRIP